MFLKKSKDNGRSQDMIIQNLTTNATQNISIVYPSALEDSFTQIFECINQKLMYCIHIQYPDGRDYDGNSSLLRMEIKKVNGNFITTYDLNSDDTQELPFVGIIGFMQRTN